MHKENDKIFEMKAFFRINFQKTVFVLQKRIDWGTNCIKVYLICMGVLFERL